LEPGARKAGVQALTATARLSAYWLACDLDPGLPMDMTEAGSRPGGTRRRKNERTRKARQNLYGQAMGRKGNETRQRLIRATVELLEKRSIRDVSVSDIATLAGTSSSSFYIYFADVSAAALAAAESIEQITPGIEALLREPWSETDAQLKAAALVEEYVSFSSQHHAILRIRNLSADEGDKRFEAVRHQAVSRIHDLLEARIAAAGNDLDPSAGASAILALMERISSIARLPLRRHHSRKSLISAAAFLLAAAMTQR
jgi:AcrR family transcriptional regulator